MFGFEFFLPITVVILFYILMMLKYTLLVVLFLIFVGCLINSSCSCSRNYNMNKTYTSRIYPSEENVQSRIFQYNIVDQMKTLLVNGGLTNLAMDNSTCQIFRRRSVSV